MERNAAWTVITMSVVATIQGCTTADYFPNSKVVSVDGVEYTVRPLNRDSGNAWQAMLTKPPASQIFLPIDPMIYAGNVKAIEAATGCPVMVETIQNGSNNTIAAVDCSRKATNSDT